MAVLSHHGGSSWIRTFGFDDVPDLVRVLENPEPAFYAAAWTAHGYLFPVYVVATFMLSTKLKWSFGKTILIMLAGTIPFMSFLTERRVAKEVSQS